MKENQTKLDLLRMEIEKCSEKEARAVVEAAEKAAAEAAESLEGELKGKRDGNIRRVTEEFRAAERKRVSEICFSEGKRVLLRRSELVEGFFGRVEERLRAAVDTPKYTDYLRSAIKKAEELSPMNGKAKVLCRECDTAVLDTALKGTDCSLEAVKDIKIGGIMVSYPETGVIIDLTLDSALEAERESFSALKEMQL